MFKLNEDAPAIWPENGETLQQLTPEIHTYKGRMAEGCAGGCGLAGGNVIRLRDGWLVYSDGRRERKSYSVPVPAIDEVVERLSGFPGLDMEAAFLLVGSIVDGGYRTDDLGFVPLKARVMEKRLGRARQKTALQAMQEAGIIQCDESYVRGEKCKGFRLRDGFEEAPITRVDLSPRMAARQWKLDREIAEKTAAISPTFAYMWRTLQRLTIDAEMSARILPDPNCPKWREERERTNRRRKWKGLPPLAVDTRLQSWRSQIQAIDEGRLYYSHSFRTGRLYHSFCNLAKPIRRSAARLEGLPLAEVDICNSQPYLLTQLYPDRTSAEARRYREIAEAGELYEAFAAWSGHELTRDVTKPEFFRVIFGDQYERAGSLIWPGIRENLPELAAVLGRFRDNELSLTLQRAESDIMVQTVATRLVAELPGVPFLPVHDSMAVPEEYAETVKAIVADCCRAAVGFAPSIRIDPPHLQIPKPATEPAEWAATA